MGGREGGSMSGGITELYTELGMISDPVNFNSCCCGDLRMRSVFVPSYFTYYSVKQVF